MEGWPGRRRMPWDTRFWGARASQVLRCNTTTPANETKTKKTTTWWIQDVPHGPLGQVLSCCNISYIYFNIFINLYLRNIYKYIYTHCAKQSLTIPKHQHSNPEPQETERKQTSKRTNKTNKQTNKQVRKGQGKGSKHQVQSINTRSADSSDNDLQNL